MATGKKSFVLYTDYDTIFEQLTDSEAGKLVKHLFKYVNDKSPEMEDRMLKILFEPIKQQLKRDLKKWDKALKKKSEGGKKGMESRWSKHNMPKDTITIDNYVKDTLTPITDNVTVNVNDTVTVNDNKNINKEDKTTKFPIEHCLTVAMNDSRWSKKNKATPEILNVFNDYLEGQAIYNFNPDEYKKYFHHWNKKKKNGSAKNFGVGQQPAVRKDEGATELTDMLKDKLASGLSS